MLLKSIAGVLVKYAGNAVGFGVAGDVIVDIWDVWDKTQPGQKDKRAEVEALAKQTADEARAGPGRGRRPRAPRTRPRATT
jgi:hypothetical protein